MPNNTVKTAEEIASVCRAQVIIDDVYDLLLGFVKQGVTEKETAAFIAKTVIDLGGSGVSFDTIVAFGENGAEPHHVPTDRGLSYGDLATVDMGAVFGGYCSDFTRTFAFGEPDGEQNRVYGIVCEAQKRAAAAVADGVRCAEVDKIARDYICENGYGEYYIHGTGHGVGVLIHEPPTLNARSAEILETNEVVTVEPGIYLPGRMGVRIEDMYIVGNANPLSRHPTELIVLN